MRLHADESVSDQRFPHVVQLSSINPVEKATQSVTRGNIKVPAGNPELNESVCVSLVLERASVKVPL